MILGINDAGEETIPQAEHAMYSGIYTQIHHPQAVGKLPLWWVIAFLAHSPFLVLLSFVYLPLWDYICGAEERDLLIRFGDTYAEYRNKTGM